MITKTAQGVNNAKHLFNSYSARPPKKRVERSLALTSGKKVRKKKHTPPPPPAPVLTIGKLISLELTLAQYEITPNAKTLAEIGGAE